MLNSEAEAFYAHLEAIAQIRCQVTLCLMFEKCDRHYRRSHEADWIDGFATWLWDNQENVERDNWMRTAIGRSPYGLELLIKAQQLLEAYP